MNDAVPDASGQQSRSTRPAIWVGPDLDDPIHDRTVTATGDAGGRVVDDLSQAEAVVWLDVDPAALLDRLHDGVRWVQLPSAGVARWLDAGLADTGVTATSAAGAYAPQVAEHALALLLACYRQLHRYARTDGWQARQTRSLAGATAAVIGAGGIGRTFLELLDGFDVTTVAVNRTGQTVSEADTTLPVQDIDRVWPRADALVLSAPATPATHHLVGDDELAAMPDHAVLVNVGRGELVDTDALVHALGRETIGAAGLDVTDPEPLPDGHPLWDEPRALITCHTANPMDRLRTTLVDRVRANVERFAAGRPLLGMIDVERGY